MLPNPYLAERLAEEYQKDALREAAESRLAREARGRVSKTAAGWVWVALPVILVVVSMWFVR